MTNAKVGEPFVVLTVSTSSKVTVAVSVSEAFRLLAVASLMLTMPPVELVRAKLEIAGAKVSMLMLGVVPALPVLPASSV